MLIYFHFQPFTLHSLDKLVLVTMLIIAHLYKSNFHLTRQ